MNRAEKQATRLLEENNVTTPPVEVERIAKGLGVTLAFEPFEGDDEISGILYRDENHTVIGINSAHANTRQRFSIAHEIGHLMLHGRKPIFVDKVVGINYRNKTSSLAIDKAEIEANAFAAELLMPREFIIKEIKNKLARKNLFDETMLIEELARKFQVSHQAMEYRLNNLGILISK